MQKAKQLNCLSLMGMLLSLSSCIHMKVLQVRNQAEKLYKEGRTDEIIPLVENAMDEVKAKLGPDHRYVGEASNGLAVLYAYTLNDFDRAEVYFKEALRIQTKTLGPEHKDTIRTINLMGFLYQVKGDFNQAEAHYKQALALRTKVLGPDHPETADSQIFLGFLYLNMGRYPEAKQLALTATRNEETKVSTRHPTPAEALSLLGAIYFTFGNYDQAEKTYLEVLEIRVKALGPNHSEVAPALGSLGAVYQTIGKYELAGQYLERCLEIQKQAFGLYHGFTGDTLFNLGMLNIRMKAYETAETYLNQSLDVYKQTVGVENYRTLKAYLGLVNLHLALKQFEPASKLCEEVLSSPEAYKLRSMLWITNLLYSVALAGTGDDNTAIFFGKQAVNELQQIRAGISQTDADMQKSFLLTKENVYRIVAKLLIRQGRLSEARQVIRMLKEDEHFDFILRSESTGTLKKTRSEFTLSETPWAERYRTISADLTQIGYEFSRLKRKKKSGLSPEEETQLKTLRQDMKVAKQAFRQFLAQVASDLQNVSPERAMEIGKKNLDSLKAMQGTLRALGEDVALIHYLATDQVLYIILTTPQVQVVRKQAVTSAELNALIFDLRTKLQDPRVNPRAAASQLYQTIFEPIARDLNHAGARSLMFSMDGALRYVPIATLHDGEGYLAEKYAVALYTEAAQTKLIKRPSQRWSLAGLGVASGIGEFAALPTVVAELEAIVRQNPDDADGVLPGVIYIDEAFTRATLEDVLDAEYPVLHIASHFVFGLHTDTDSYLLLGDGTALSLASIREEDYDFNGVEMLTLSACETALGKPGADGREIEGLGWLAQRQGAESVLATLWPVADVSTGIFMQAMYQLRQDENLTKAEALRRAQLAFIQSKRLSHPFFWAPFILMGNWL